METVHPNCCWSHWCNFCRKLVFTKPTSHLRVGYSHFLDVDGRGSKLQPRAKSLRFAQANFLYLHRDRCRFYVDIRNGMDCSGDKKRMSRFRCKLFFCCADQAFLIVRLHGFDLFFSLHISRHEHLSWKVHFADTTKRGLRLTERSDLRTRLDF